MSSLNGRHKDHILEAIDQMRQRKARPDSPRICNFLFRKYSINSEQVEKDLQWCVENNIVLRVEYKGFISYRNAAAKKNLILKRDSQGSEKTLLSDRNKANRKFAQFLTSAFSELIVNEPDYLEFGVPGYEIIKNILSKDSVRYKKNYINILLDKEVENGGLIKLENGNFLMGPETVALEGKSVNERDENNGTIYNRKHTSSSYNTVKLKSKKKYLKIHQHGNFRKENIGNSRSMLLEDKRIDGVRVGVRRKRAKKVFDPSDNHIPKKRGRPTGSLNKTTLEKQTTRLSDESRPESRTSNNGRDQFGVCSVCHLQNKKGPNDRMVSCRECSNKAHFSCLNGDDMMLRMHPDNTWQCPHCKTCVTCFETSDAGSLTVCSVCADAYHAGCHQPRIIEKVKNTKWLCINCQMPEELEIDNIQTNMTFNNKPNASMNDEESSESNSDNELPSTYDRSSQSSPAAPRLSPQVTLPNGKRANTPDRDTQSESPSNRSSDEDLNTDPSIPDATHWTPDEVYQYFYQFVRDEAKVFKEQEIDGRSLLLLRRVDILTSLKLKLGPALKIYKQVVKLQVRRDDPKLYWL